MSNQFDATEYAARLGVTREVYPEFFTQRYPFLDRPWEFVYDCTLPSPYSNGLRTCLWIPFLLEALGSDAESVMDEYFQVLRHYPDLVKQTPLQAALAAAFDAKEAACSQPKP